MVMNVYSYYVCSERMQFIRHSEASFDDLIYSVIHFLYVIPHFYLIPCHWKEFTKVGNYFVHWSEFQVRKKSVYNLGPPSMISGIHKSVYTYRREIFDKYIPMFNISILRVNSR